MSHIYCPECGFQSPETAHYCSRCGALLVVESAGETTLSFTPEELAGEAVPVPDEGIRGPALVVRSGGGRAGESFQPGSGRTIIERSVSLE